MLTMEAPIRLVNHHQTELDQSPPPLEERHPTLLIAIVNTREADMTIQCLRSLDAEMKLIPGMMVSVADNNSGDGSEEKLLAEMERLGWGERGRVVQVGRNGGFSVGNNAALRPMYRSDHPPDYYFLLNPDTIAQPGSFQTLLDFMESHPEIGLAGSRCVYPNGQLQLSSFRFHSFFSEMDNAFRFGLLSRLLKKWAVVVPLPDTPTEFDWIGGAAFMFRKSVVDKIGLLDEGYFVYYEETDYCLRAKRAGFTSWYVPQSKIIHIEGQSTGVSDRKKAPKRRARYWFESRRRYFELNHGRFYSLFTDIGWVIGFSTFKVRQFIQRKPNNDPPHFLWDFIRFNFFTRKPHHRSSLA